MRSPFAPRPVTVEQQVTCRKAIQDVVFWSESKAGNRKRLIEELRARCPEARGLSDESQISRWKGGVGINAEVFVAMVSFVSDQSVDQLYELLYERVRPPRGQQPTRRPRKGPATPAPDKVQEAVSRLDRLKANVKSE